MPTSDLIVSQPSPGVMTLTLNRPAKRNALGGEIVDDMLGALDAANAAGVRLLVLKGNGASFCSGFDLSNLDAESDGDLLLRFVRIEMLLQRLHSAPFTTLVFAHGRTYGAGADIVAACDKRIVASDAKFAFPGVGFGIVLGTGRLIGRVGADRAQEIVQSGREIDTAEALAIGLATARISEGEADDLIAREHETAMRLDRETSAAIRAVMTGDGATDLTHLVRSAARPGLKARIQAYRDKVQSRGRPK